jgi:hypothetical protein
MGSYRLVHFNTVEQKDKFINFVRKKDFIGPHGKNIKFRLSIASVEVDIGNIVSKLLLN